ncbi:MAG: pilus assembly protein TadG-related protein [Alphaproteobacteria bacterium]
MVGSDGFLQYMSGYIRQTSGAIAIMFALMVPVLVGVVGASVDLSRAYLVKQRLSQALDAAALAATASSTDSAEITQKVLDFFNANYPSDELGIIFTPTVQVVGDEVIVTGYAQYNTLFLSVVGIDTLDVGSETTVVREVQGIEVVLVMDNTGSMSTNNNISSLRNAASNFVYIMYGIDTDDGAAADPSALDDMATRDRDYIKVGLVPYSTSVNVGPYGFGEDLNGDYYGASFVNNPHGFDYTTYYNTSSNWFGCVLAHDYPDDTLDHEGPWDIYRYCRDEDDDPYCDTKWQNGSLVVRQKPNYNCVRTPLTPLVTSPTQLKDSIDTMVASGYTYGNYGMVWGGRVLSEDFPFEEGVEWGNQYWRKAIVMMTDGDNTMHNKYSAYGPTQDHNIDVGDLNTRFGEVCDDLKEKGVLIYTVTFYSNISDSTKDYYRDCATAESYYYDAPNQSDLIEAFETISRELSNLHIKN